MGSKRPALTYRRLRAPRGDGEVLIDPGWDECLQHPQFNSSLCDGLEFSLLGRSYQALRTSIRQDLLRLAVDYTASYSSANFLPAELSNEILAKASDVRIVMSGHQPRLFHPGVWAKNFAVAGLAEQIRGVAVHVIIDNDTMREHALRLPTGTKENPQQVIEPFDSFSEPLPFEVRKAIDRELLASFPTRVQKRLHKLIPRPLIVEMWPNVMSAVERGKPLGHAFAEARHLLEYEWGLRTLEVPLSHLCEMETFRWLVFAMLVNGARLTASYNDRLGEYRKVHKLRSPAQPLPNLREVNGWTEAPFWLWLKENHAAVDSKQPLRQALWWKHEGRDLLIRNESASECWTLPNALSTPTEAFHQFQELCNHVVSIRPRALTNTIFLRLFASDAFIHGIGGAKYDQVTDLIMSDFFDAEGSFSPPKFIALSQTSHLPLTVELITKADCAKQRQRIRKMYFHPERYLDAETTKDPQVSCIAEKKTKLVERKPDRGNGKRRHQEIADCNAKLRQLLQKNTEKEHEILRHLEQRQRASSILGSREWSFTLFPEDYLKELMLDLRAASP